MSTATTPGEADVDEHQLLAAVVTATPHVRLRETLVLSCRPETGWPGLDMAERQLLTHWLSTTAHSYFGRGARAVAAHQALPTPPDGLGLVLTEEVAALRLPLLALAADLATTLPTGTLRVEAGTLLGARGCADRARGLVVLNLDRISQDGSTPGRVWAHELSHLLDPDPELAPIERKERWARTLGALLLSHQPGSRVEAEELVRQLHAARPPLLDTPQRLDPATQADLKSLMLFASLELGRPAAALVESHR